MRRKRLKTREVRELEEQPVGRCGKHHPNWLGVTCERKADLPGVVPHYSHHAEGRTFEWTND